MDRLDSLRLFTRIIESGSFTKAAETLGIPRASATYAIQELEARLDTRLLERSTRHVRPTLDGKAFYERCIHILGELDDAESTLRNVAANPKGKLRVDMHGAHATHIVLPQIDLFRGRYPGIDLVVSSGDRLVDLVREGVDCVIRAGTPRDSSLVARHLADMPQVICASPDYLSRFGVPQHPDELSSHEAVNFFASSGAIDYPIQVIMDNRTKDFPTRGWISVNDAENYVQCALRGCGLIQLPRFHVEEELKAGRLVEVLERWPSPTMRLSALYPYRRQLSQRVRVFVDWLCEIYELRFGSLAANQVG